MARLYIRSQWKENCKSTPSQKTLRYGTRFQGIPQFYLPPTHLSTNEMNHTCLCLLSRSWSSFIDPGKMEDWVGLGTTKVSKQPAHDCYVTSSQLSAAQTVTPHQATKTHQATRVKLTTSCTISRDANPLRHRDTQLIMKSAIQIANYAEE